MKTVLVDLTVPYRYFWTYNSGLQAQAVMQTQATLQDDPQILLDPNKLSDDGTVCPLCPSHGPSDTLCFSVSTIAEPGNIRTQFCAAGRFHGQLLLR